ncbi:MAG: hypothetical protein M3P26_04220 [Gemmatimonadota bacterium]|nr:hypothetical protein [Gemmatimonadota bacterium]
MTSVAGGRHSGASQTIQVKTQSPPLEEAHLSGTYHVTYTVTSSSLSNTHPGQISHYTWSLKASCRQGACGGKWIEKFRDGAHAVGHYHPTAGGSYLAEMKNQSLGFCGSVNDMKDSSSLRIRLTKAGMKDGKWTALVFTGTLREYFPGENGCASSYFQAQIDGKRGK